MGVGPAAAPPPRRARRGAEKWSRLNRAPGARVALRSARLQVGLLQRLHAAVRERHCVPVVRLLARQHALPPRLAVQAWATTGTARSSRPGPAAPRRAAPRRGTERARLLRGEGGGRDAHSTRRAGAAGRLGGAADSVRRCSWAPSEVPANSPRLLRATCGRGGATGSRRATSARGVPPPPRPRRRRGQPPTPSAVVSTSRAPSLRGCGGESFPVAFTLKSLLDRNSLAARGGLFRRPGSGRQGRQTKMRCDWRRRAARARRPPDRWLGLAPPCPGFRRAPSLRLTHPRRLLAAASSRAKSFATSSTRSWLRPRPAPCRRATPLTLCADLLRHAEQAPDGGGASACRRQKPGSRPRAAPASRRSSAASPRPSSCKSGSRTTTRRRTSASPAPCACRTCRAPS